VLGTWLFVALWVVLGLGVFYIAFRGGFGTPRRAPARRPSFAARQVGVATLVIVYVGFGIAIPLGFLVGNHAHANSQVGGLPLTAAEKQGRQLFGQHCGVCHTLAAANAVGKVGPNLDVIKPSASLVLHTIDNGCLQSPPAGDAAMSCLGYGTMPAGVVQGQQAQDVAQFVARVAGNE
jgi:mono/diheme cytochrome c family protein